MSEDKSNLCHNVIWELRYFYKVFVLGAYHDFEQ